MGTGRRIVPVLIASAFGLAGCGTEGLSVRGGGGGVDAASGIEHTMNGIVYKTYTVELAQVHGAVLSSMGRMGMTVREDVATELGRKIVASAAEREIEIELEQLTDRTTRMRVEAGRGLLLNDRATASEIVTQTGIALDERTGNEKSRARAS